VDVADFALTTANVDVGEKTSNVLPGCTAASVLIKAADFFHF
jgi:hypothetical protein